MKRSHIRNYLLISFLIIQFTCLAQDRLTGRNFATRSEVIAGNGMVASSHPLATQIGLDILKKGGTAVDAAIAVNAALGLMEPTGSGIGGDLFAIVWDSKTQKLSGLNASGRSPQNLTLDYFKDHNIKSIPSSGPLPVSVPGCVDGWFELHDKFGKLPMSEILAPSIKYAEEGFPVTELIAFYLNGSVKRYMSEFPNVEETYTDNGKIPEKGDIFRNPLLAATYKKLAEKGRDVFYKGEIASTITKFIQGQGGFLSMKDFEDHTSTWVEPISTNYRGYDIWELPPNGQGLATLQMLNIIEGYDFTGIPYGSAGHLHIVNEAKKLVFEDRAEYYADPDFSDIPVEQLLSKEYASKRRDLIKMNRAGVFKAGKTDHSSTVYFTVADKDGNMISMIQSNYRGMGSGMVPPKLGFMLQDRGELFNLEEGKPNSYAPGKRPFHTIIPGFITVDGAPYLSFGVMGGDFQPQGHVQIIMNLIDFGMGLQEAGDAPRFEHVGSSSVTGEISNNKGEILIESGFSFEEIQKLMALGHKVGFGGYYGGYQAILYDAEKGVYFGASESRKDGNAAGY
ncbi:gamma-glutamyltranspeptidase/glutathione hydrolase [Gillisia sp. Hel_I_86]|uniref:gamma-glutamyltransferase n=1 Tax=Gillisia sp. Hel_I_86 TaxID=1249981 RepID=UPI00119BC04B|nr:gamma-glutamyltransferase [Gillisia sp. Hel_I_86]TVZ26027.1 gamma-glutamyltranspeptidase/glutathione hydrolase [Gillisia sp. Hel_I_86]